MDRSEGALVHWGSPAFHPKMAIKVTVAERVARPFDSPREPYGGIN